MDFIENDSLMIRQQNNLTELCRVIMYCDDEILDGIDHQIPMTQQLYERTKCKLIQIKAYKHLNAFLEDFANFAEEEDKKGSNIKNKRQK